MKYPAFVSAINGNIVILDVSVNGVTFIIPRDIHNFNFEIEIGMPVEVEVGMNNIIIRKAEPVSLSLESLETLKTL